MPRIRDALDPDSILAPSPLCKAFGRLEMAVWRVLLWVSLVRLFPDGETGTDASGFERAHASAHYTKRTNLTVQQVEDDATGRYRDQRSTRYSRDDNVEARYTVRTTGCET